MMKQSITKLATLAMTLNVICIDAVKLDTAVEQCAGACTGDDCIDDCSTTDVSFTPDADGKSCYMDCSSGECIYVCVDCDDGVCTPWSGPDDDASVSQSCAMCDPNDAECLANCCSGDECGGQVDSNGDGQIDCSILNEEDPSIAAASSFFDSSQGWNPDAEVEVKIEENDSSYTPLERYFNWWGKY